MNLCNVCKKYFNEPHDCTTTREEKLPIVLYVEKGSFTFNCVESAEKLHGWGSPEKYILNKEHESLLREARAKARSSAILFCIQELRSLQRKSNHERDWNHSAETKFAPVELSDWLLINVLRKYESEEQATKARKE